MFRLPVILVDDSDDDIQLFERLIQKAGGGIDVRSFSNADEAMAYIGPGSSATVALPRAIFLDIKMPLIDGFDFLRWFRNQDAFTGVPAIVLSSSDDPKDIARARELGAQCYLTKYPRVDVLADLIRRIDSPSEKSEMFRCSSNLLLNL